MQLENLKNKKIWNFYMKKYRKIIAIQGDPIQKTNIKTDTTLLLALEAQRRGYNIYYYQTKDLTFSKNIVKALTNKVEFIENKKNFYSIKTSKVLDLSKTRFILMRQNPPFNMDYITATFLLEKISKKTQIINNPFAVRNMPEKLHSIDFLRFMPPTIFTKSIIEIDKFRAKYKEIVIKPTHGYGGKNILFVNKSTKKIKITSYLKQNEHVMVQKFISDIKYGDKRIFIIGGAIKGAIRRIPKKGSIVSNIGQGGKAVETILTKREVYIAKIVAKNLKKNKIIFAGIDLIGNYLTGDINITSPTGLKNFKDLTGKNLAIDFWDYLEKR
tara:strand:+ start:933 stop:1916 length:984 start_codon:yes stop_codon:yes gene_type:complete